MDNSHPQVVRRNQVLRALKRQTRRRVAPLIRCEAIVNRGEETRLVPASPTFVKGYRHDR